MMTPIPSEAYLKKYGFRLTGICKFPELGEIVHSMNYANRIIEDIPPFVANESHKFDKPRWILQKIEIPPDQWLKEQNIELASEAMTWEEALRDHRGKACCVFMPNDMKWYKAEAFVPRSTDPKESQYITYLTKNRIDQFIPWTVNARYAGIVVKQKKQPEIFGIIIGGIKNKEFYIAGHGAASPDELLRDWIKTDGSPCGDKQ